MTPTYELLYTYVLQKGYKTIYSMSNYIASSILSNMIKTTGYTEGDEAYLKSTTIHCNTM